MDNQAIPTTELPPVRVDFGAGTVEQFVRRENSFLRLLELYLWMFAAFGAAWPFFGDRIFYPHISTLEIFQENGRWLFLGIAIFIFPLLYRLIFDAFPIQSLRRRVRQRLGIQTIEVRKFSTTEATNYQSETLTPSSSYEWLHRSHEEHKRFLACIATQSAGTANGIYSRAGVYLLVGVGIAFSGLAFFYLETGALKSTNDVTTNLLLYAPRFGILFFIELIAFFFLRQYRAAMEEYRYYESLQRHREELLALALLSERQGKSLDGATMVKQGAFYSGKEILSKGQSTEILEARKLEKDELELLGKVVETVGKKKA